MICRAVALLLPTPFAEYRSALGAGQKADKRHCARLVIASRGQRNACIAVDAAVGLKRHDVGNARIGLRPDREGDPGVDARIRFPAFQRECRVLGIEHDIAAKRLERGDIAILAGDVFPHALLAGAINDRNLDARFEQIGETANVLRIAGTDENANWTHVERRDRRGHDRTGKGPDEVTHHYFGSAVDDVAVGFHRAGPFRGRAGRDDHLNAIRLAEGRSRFLHGRRRTAWTVDMDGFGRCRERHHDRQRVGDIGDKRPDVDIVVVTNIDSTTESARDAMDRFIPFLEKWYPGKWRPQGRSFGIEMSLVDMDLVITALPTDQNSRDFMTRLYRSQAVETLDTLEEARSWRLNEDWRPFVPSPFGDSRQIIELADAPREKWQPNPLWLPDRDADGWGRTHPLAQIQWTAAKNRANDGNYVDIVRAIKWWRQTNSDSLPKYPKGYPLEHMIGHVLQDGTTSMAQGVVQVFESMRDNWALLAAASMKPRLSDHGVPEHDVLKRLDVDDFKAFHAAAASAAEAKDKSPENAAFTLVTTDRIKDGDQLLDLLSSDDRRLRLDKLFVPGGDKSRMGRVRKLWCDHLGLSSDVRHISARHVVPTFAFGLRLGEQWREHTLHPFAGAHPGLAARRGGAPIFGEKRIGCELRDRSLYGPEEAAAPVPMILGGQLLQKGEGFLVKRFKERKPVRKIAIERRTPDAGQLNHMVERCLDARPGKHRARRVEELLSIDEGAFLSSIVCDLFWGSNR